MNRRNFFARMSQGVAAAVLATHLSFGNLVPIPMQQKFKWVKLIVQTFVTPNTALLGGQNHTLNMIVEDVTDPAMQEGLELYEEVGKQRVEKWADGSLVEYLKVPTFPRNSREYQLAEKELDGDYGRRWSSRPRLNLIGA